MRIAFLSGPYRANHNKTVIEHIRIAEAAAIRIWRISPWCVICPHLNSAFMDGVTSDETFLSGCLEIIYRLDRTSDVLVLLPDWEKSNGALAERELATRLGIRVTTLSSFLAQYETTKPSYL